MDKQFSDAYDFMQKTLNENVEPGPPTEEEFNKYYDEFQAGKSVADYIFRNFLIGDGEEFQTMDDDTEEVRQETAEEIKKELPEIADELIGALNSYYAESNSEEFVQDLVKPYISNPELADADFTAWQEIFWMVSQNNKSYEEFLTEYEN